jgi:hypothetical protein
MKPMNYYATRRLWRVAVLIAALKSGIVIPVIPPVLICIGLTVMAYKKRNQFNEE